MGKQRDDGIDSTPSRVCHRLSTVPGLPQGASCPLGSLTRGSAPTAHTFYVFSLPKKRYEFLLQNEKDPGASPLPADFTQLS